MPLVVVHDELACAPRGVMHLFHERHTGSTEAFRSLHCIRRVEVQVKMFVAVHDLNRGVPGIDELEMKELRTGANPRVEIVMAKGQFEPGQRGVEPDLLLEVRGP